MTEVLSGPPAPATRSRMARVLRAGLAVLVLGWVAVVALLLLRADHALRSGVDEISALRADLSTTAIDQGSARVRADRARIDFRRAHMAVANPFLWPIRPLPVLGRQLRSLTALSGGAEQVAAVGAKGLVDAQAILAEPHAEPRSRIDSLRQFAAMATRIDGSLRDISLGPGQALIGPLADKRDEFAVDLTRLRLGLERSAAAANGVADVLEGTHSYLLLLSNNAEMRDGSGMFLSAAVMHTRDGAIDVGPPQKTADLLLPGAGVPISGDLDARWGWLHPGREWRNLGVSPNFPVAAEVASRMWVAEGNPAVDGVIAVDVVALKEILAAVGPVAGPNGDLSADNVEEFLLHDQYQVADPASAGRSESLGAVAAGAMAALQGPDVRLPSLGPGMARAAGGRHIMAWSADPASQRNWTTAGLSGALQPDTVLVTLLNRGANKLDPFITMACSMSVQPHGDVTDVDITVDLRNDMPAGQPTYVAGPNEGLTGPPGRYIGLLAANVPGAAGRLAVDSLTEYAAAGPDGPTQVVAVPVTIDAGQSGRYSIHFQLAGRHGTMAISPSARVPAIRWRAMGVPFTDDSVRNVQW